MSTEERRWDAEIRQLCQRCRFAEALTLSRRFIDTLTDAYGERHEKVAWALQNFSRICRQIDDYDQAFAACHRAIGIVEQLGDRPRDLASLLSNLSLLYVDCDCLQEAEMHCRRAVHLLEAEGDAGSDQLGAYLDNLAMILARQDRFADALSCGERALSIFQRTLARGHPKISGTMRNLADLRSRVSRG